jgi:hypothetical protein
MKTGAGPFLLAFVLSISSACSKPEARGPCDPAPPFGTICGFENPEDVEWVPSADLVVVSNIRMWNVDIPGGGTLSALKPGSTEVRKLWPLGAASDFAPDPALGDPKCPGPLRPEAFYNHGIVSAPRGDSALLYAVGHRAKGGAGREAVEVFELTGKGKKAVVAWKACIPTENAIQGNDAAVAPDGELFISNYEPDGSPWHTIRSILLGQNTGDVMGWKRDRGWRHLAGTTARQPNGVAVAPDGKSVFYAELGSGKVHRVAIDGSGARASADVGGNPDNLSWTSRGTLLVATHTGGARFMGCAAGRLPCRTSWEIFEIDPATMSSTLRQAHRGDELGAVSAASEAKSYVYLGSVFDDRIGVYPVLP